MKLHSMSMTAIPLNTPVCSRSLGQYKDYAICEFHISHPGLCLKDLSVHMDCIVVFIWSETLAPQCLPDLCVNLSIFLTNRASSSTLNMWLHYQRLKHVIYQESL